MSLKEVFENKSVLITGHTGFKGSWLAMWLKSIGANVVGIAIEPPSSPSHFDAVGLKQCIKDHRLDIRNCKALKKLVFRTQPDFVFHLAAQSIVRLSYEDPVTTYEINTIGTLNMMEALRTLDKKCIVVLITSDKCYNNLEWVWGYRETDLLGGPDPYSASKGSAELMIHSHIKSFFPGDGSVRIAIGRAGNVIGGGDWATDRIVPDCVRFWSKEESVPLRNPHSIRPWQHVLEPLYGYLTLAKELNQREELHGEPFNFGPPTNQSHTVLELVQEMSLNWEKVIWNDNSKTEKKFYESGLLKLNCDKALQNLHWQAVLSFQETVRMTAEWYKSYYDNPDIIRDVTLSQIHEYESFALKKNML